MGSSKCSICPAILREASRSGSVPSGSLFSGDAIYDGIIVDNLPGSDVQSYRATMKRIAELPVAQVFGGHNAPMTRTHMLDVVIRYLASRP